MSGQPICPHCNQGLGEEIPQAVEGFIQLKCPFCGMVYSFHHDDTTFPVEVEEEYYLSSGLFRKRPVLGDGKITSRENEVRMRFYLLCLCIIGPLVLLGLFAMLVSLSSVLGWLGP